MLGTPTDRALAFLDRAEEQIVDSRNEIQIGFDTHHLLQQINSAMALVIPCRKLKKLHCDIKGWCAELTELYGSISDDDSIRFAWSKLSVLHLQDIGWAIVQMKPLVAAAAVAEQPETETVIPLGCVRQAQSDGNLRPIAN